MLQTHIGHDKIANPSVITDKNWRISSVITDKISIFASVITDELWKKSF